MFILNDELKDGVGILIEYYRKQKLESTKDRKWRVCNFIKGKSGRLLCTDKTYKKLSGGEHTDDDTVYDCLIRRLGFTFQGMDLSTSNKLSFVYRKLLEAVERNDNLNIDLYSMQALAILKGYEQSLFFSENVEVIQVIRKYYLESILMDEKTYLKYYEIWNAFEENLQIIIKELLYRYCHLTYHDITKLNELSERIDLKNEMSAMLQINYIGQLIFNQDCIGAFSLANSLIAKLTLSKNYNLLLTVHSILITICLNSKSSDLKLYMLNMEDVLKKFGNSITSQRKAKCYYTLGMQYYVNKDILKSYNYLCEAIKLDKLCFQEAGIFIRHIKSFYDVEPIDLSQFKIADYSTRFQIFYRYFDLKEKYMSSLTVGEYSKSSLRDLENYILKEVLPLITKSKVALIELFQEEIDWITSKSFNYSNSQKFRTKINELSTD